MDSIKYVCMCVHVHTHLYNLCVNKFDIGFIYVYIYYVCVNDDREEKGPEREWMTWEELVEMT